ncbi:hypothetical protein E0L21_23805 [Kosakonia quasisacchari]|uniref:Uncharacterized protein n=1 Tax=Kosakonia quasisacchari TaxID=2529380 RepID=A0A4R0GJY9_9ENTR|nr:hypothetical protein [Kosakonia quasisacchari]TCB96653.1 hypothetical protein E0L21_23805 [Kosakonia quasisacchari]
MLAGVLKAQITATPVTGAVVIAVMAASVEPAGNPVDLYNIRTSLLVLICYIKVIVMCVEKKWHYFYLFISFLVVPVLYLNLGMVVYWFYSIPKIFSLMILWVVIPVGTYVSVKYLALTFRYIFNMGKL